MTTTILLRCFRTAFPPTQTEAGTRSGVKRGLDRRGPGTIRALPTIERGFRPRDCATEAPRAAFSQKGEKG